MRAFALVALLLGAANAAHAQDLFDLSSPYSPLVREGYYEQLAKRPGRAFGWELLVPGGGNYYTGLVAPAAATMGASVLGASLWIAGALTHREPMEWTGLGVFAGARAYGLVSAPIGAALLNAALRQQLGITLAY